MIDEYWTWIIFGYHSDELSYGSQRPIVAMCDRCCKYRRVIYRSYADMCSMCVGIGRHHTEATKQIMAERKIGSKLSDETKLKISKKTAGDKNPMYGRRGKDSPIFGSNNPNYGVKFSDITRQRNSASHQGIPYEEWTGFSIPGGYCEKFDDACRERIRKKYGHKCFICDKPQEDNITKTAKKRKLSVHHADMNKQQGCGDHEWRLVPLCMSCHSSSHTDEWQARVSYILNEIDKIEDDNL